MTVYIFGTSGFARETRDIVAAMGWEAVFIAAGPAERDAWNGRERIILEDELPNGARCTIGIGDNKLRQKIATRFDSRCTFVNLVHPSATFGVGQREMMDHARGVIVCAGVRFTNSIEVGDFAIFNLNATIGHDVMVGDYVNIAPGANISGYVMIGNGVWIGTNAAINQGHAAAPLTIGEGATIGSGSVVVKPCEPNLTYVGIPAKAR
jgi:sugar O-acyltransferase (sialic acid O-acetyltransferase NeuD family)